MQTEGLCVRIEAFHVRLPKLNLGHLRVVVNDVDVFELPDIVEREARAIHCGLCPSVCVRVLAKPLLAARRPGLVGPVGVARFSCAWPLSSAHSRGRRWLL